MEIKVLRDILEANELIARQNRQLFDRHGLYVVNLMASPGAGKTSLLERTLEGLGGEFRMGVITGDVATQLDAERLGRHGVPVLQISTGGECHLEARMIRRALDDFDLEGLDILFIENVGNLICPAEFVLGEDARVMILSTPEGDDKPEKYPLMFRQSRALVINKIDLLGMVDFDLDKAKERAWRIKPKLAIFPLSCRTGEGLEAWFNWLRKEVASR